VGLLETSWPQARGPASKFLSWRWSEIQPLGIAGQVLAVVDTLGLNASNITIDSTGRYWKSNVVCSMQNSLRNHNQLVNSRYFTFTMAVSEMETAQ
jgi:hypothetical protein